MHGAWFPRAVALFVLTVPAWAGDSDLRLELESSVRTVRLGQETTLRLRIIGPGIGRITEKSEGISPKNPAVGAFTQELAFKPPREGNFTFGPYRLSFNGRELTSNRVSIFVLPAWDGTYGTFFRTDSNSITRGESIEFVMETWSKRYEPKLCVLKRDAAFTATQGESIMSSMASDNSTWVYTRTVWFVTPKEAGDFRLTRDAFLSLPEAVEPPDITVTVKARVPVAEATVDGSRRPSP